LWTAVAVRHVGAESVPLKMTAGRVGLVYRHPSWPMPPRWTSRTSRRGRCFTTLTFRTSGCRCSTWATYGPAGRPNWFSLGRRPRKTSRERPYAGRHRPWRRPATSTHTGAGEPVQVYGAGVRLPLDCCYEHAGLCPGRGPSGGSGRRGSPHGESEGCHGGHVRPGGRAGCRQGFGDGMRPHARSTQRPVQRNAHVQDYVRFAAG
jgi:hypothetical protein